MGVKAGAAGGGSINRVAVSAGSSVQWGSMVSQHETYIEEKEGEYLTFLGDGVKNDGEMMFKPYTHRWTVGYTKRQYARMQDFVRGAADEYDDPYIVILPALTASTVTAVGEYRPPIDHFRQIKGSWSRGVRYELTHSMEADREKDEYRGLDWEYLTVWEPTTERGRAAGGFAHCHPVVVCDGDPGEDRFRSVIRKHVEKCDWAEPEAHDFSEIDVRPLDELNNPAAYLFKYLGKSWSRDDAAPFQKRFDALLYETGYRRFQPSDGAQRWMERGDEEEPPPGVEWTYAGAAGTEQVEYLRRFEDAGEFEIVHEMGVGAYLSGYEAPPSVEKDDEVDTDLMECSHPEVYRGKCVKCGVDVEALNSGVISPGVD